MADLIDVLKRERSQLITELLGDPRYVKLQKIDELLATYSGSAAQENASKPKKPARPKASTVTISGQPSKRAQIEDAIKTYLSAKGSSHRNSILEHLRMRGLLSEEIKNPLQRLAIYLSEMRGIVEGDGFGNWQLTEEAKKEAEKGLFG